MTGSSWLVLSWEPSDGASHYIAEYRLTFDPTWSNFTTPISSVNISNIYPDATYQVSDDTLPDYHQVSGDTLPN